MPKVKRQRRERTDEWQQLRLLTTWPEQTAYELIRPIVLFGQVPAERARETGAAERTLHRQAQRFETYGMAGLLRPSPKQRADAHRSLPQALRRAIVELKVEYPAFRPHEIATICSIRFGRRPSPHTVTRVLAGSTLPARRARRYPANAEMADAAERRLAIIRLHIEGWNARNIAGYLQISRTTVHTTLRRWIEEGVRGLDDKSHANTHRVRKVTLAAQSTVRKLQQNPELGEFRIHAALKQLGISLSPRTCGRILALNRRLYGLPTPQRAPREPREKQPMPFKATRRHEFWSVDVRYIEQHQIPEIAGPFYVISVLENFSRAILASDIFQRQDLTAYLIVLHAAICQHGAPEALVSDGGTIFRAKQAMVIYEELGIRKERIATRQAWQNYIETCFNVQRRMADVHFARATSWEEAKQVHAGWVADYNYQPHYAHRLREDQRHSPSEVLDWVHGRWHSPEELHRIFYATRFARRLDRSGYVRFWHWRLYGEEALGKRGATLWLYNETLTVALPKRPSPNSPSSMSPTRNTCARCASHVDSRRPITRRNCPYGRPVRCSGISFDVCPSMPRVDRPRGARRSSSNRSSHDSPPPPLQARRDGVAATGLSHDLEQ